MPRKLSKIVVIFMLVLLVLGPALQIFDFMDGCVQDGDGLLHVVDACLCVALVLLASIVLFYFLDLSSWLHGMSMPERQCERFSRYGASLIKSLTFGTPPIPLRI